MFIKSKIVEDAVSTHDLTKIDVQKKENQIVCFENVENLKIVLKKVENLMHKE